MERKTAADEDRARYGDDHMHERRRGMRPHMRIDHESAEPLQDVARAGQQVRRLDDADDDPHRQDRKREDIGDAPPPALEIVADHRC